MNQVAQLIGMMVSCFPGVEYGELFSRQLWIEKAAALKTNNRDFEQIGTCRYFLVDQECPDRLDEDWSWED